MGSVLWQVQQPPPGGGQGQQPPPPPPSGARPPPPAGGGLIGTPAPPTAPIAEQGLPMGVVAVVAILAVVIVAAVVASTRRKRPSGNVVLSPPVPRPPSDMDQLLEVSRRLTAAASSGDIDRSVVREALGLVRASGASLVRTRDDQLVVAAESHPDLLNNERLNEGTILRVAETGQPIVQVSATEPAIRHLPAALAAVPLVGGGRVEAVLILVRPEVEPFTAPERDVLSALAPVAAAALHNADQVHASLESSLIDPLTQVGNRRRFDAELADALGDGHPNGIVIIDLDHFKKVNDTYGHPAGDAVLQAIAVILRETIRPQDSAYRFGGEEFCVLLRDATELQTLDVAERLRGAIEAKPFSIGQEHPLHVTASFGAAATRDADVGALISRADEALYDAKRGGRNRVGVR